jgi:plastocyanin
MARRALPLGIFALALVLVPPPPAARAQAPRPTGKITGKVTVTETGGAPVAGAEVIVYVTGFEEPPAKTSVTIAQQGRRFVPDLVSITAGDRVAFPNNDPFLHNVFSQSSTRKFDLGSYRRGEQKDKEFPAAGVVDVYCNIHPEMAATILVLPNRRHTRVGPDGRFTLDGVPPGTWTVFAYTRRASKPGSAAVTVTAGAESSVDLAVVRGAEVEHRNKYGAKYTGPGGTYR